MYQGIGTRADKTGYPGRSSPGPQPGRCRRRNMTHLINSIPVKRLMKKWGLGKSELAEIIDSELLQIYYAPYYDLKYFSAPFPLFPVPSLEFADYDPEKLFFKRAEVEHFEKKYRKNLPSTASLYSDNEKEIAKQDIPSVDIQDDKQKTGTRSKPTQAIYIAAAGYAETEIQSLIKYDILPKTRKEKLASLMTNKEFQKIIAALPRKVSEKYLIRKLNEVRPGLWQMGESSNKK